jgi:hypothetical protein
MGHSAQTPARIDWLPPGHRVGAWIVREAMAAGGAGTVYLGEAASTGERVAIKVLNARMAAHPTGVARFERECELLARLDHPGIVKVVASGTVEDGGAPYIVMELVSARTLEDLLAQSGRLSPERTLALLEPICSALACAHGAGVVHRDVKASNISVGDGDAGVVVKLLDFGLAKLSELEPGGTAVTLPGSRVGTPEAMAPEQIRGEAVGPAADVYALGVLIHRLLTGAFPFAATTRQELEQLHLESSAPRPSRLAPISPALDEVVARCLEKEPRARWSSPREVLEALRAAVQGVDEEGRAAAVAIHVAAAAPGASVTRDQAGRALAAAGFQLVLQTANSLVGVRTVPPGAHGAREALGVARELRALLPGAQLIVHAGVAQLSGTEVIGGAILEVAEWQVMATLDGVFITAQVAAGLDRDSVTPVALP